MGASQKGMIFESLIYSISLVLLNFEVAILALAQRARHRYPVIARISIESQRNRLP